MAAIEIISAFSWGADKLQITEGVGGATVAAPQVVSAASTAKDRVLVTFDQALLFDLPISEALRPTNYQITDDIFGAKLYVARCSRISNTEVELLTQDQRAIPYTCTVKRVQNEYATPIGSSDNTGQFVGTSTVGHFPSVSKIYSFWGLYGGMQTTEQTALFPDITPPYLDNHDPSPGEVSVALDDHIIFDIVDAENGVDTDYTVVWFDGAIIWQNDAPEPGWAGTRVEINPTRQRYDISRSGNLPEGKLCSVEVLMRDTATLQNPTIESYGFTTASVAPYLQNHDPEPGATGQDPSTNIYVEVVDDDSNVVINSVQISIGGILAWQADAPQLGFSGSKIPVPGGYAYTLDPDTDFSQGFSVTVQVQAADDAPAPGVLSTAYTFQTIVLQGQIFNPSFEVAGDEPGEADGWTVLFDQAAEQIAPFEASLLPVDDFEAAWGGGNQLSQMAFEDDDLNPCGFNSARAQEVIGTLGVPWGSGLWGVGVWGSSGGDLLSGTAFVAVVEEFMWEWRMPRRYRTAQLSNSGRPSPLHPSPTDALAVGTQYRDLTTGGLAYVFSKDVGSSRVNFTFVDWLNPVGQQLGFVRDERAGGSLGVGHVLAERSQGSHYIARAEDVDGLVRQFSATISLLPLHPKLSGWDSTFRIAVQIDQVVHTVSDDGTGVLVSTSDILDAALPNSVDYVTGAVALSLSQAPDASVAIKAFFEYGATVCTQTADDASNLPHVVSAGELDEPTEELPPYNHSSADAFLPGNLEAAQIGGAKGPEDFEVSWDSPGGTGSSPWNEDSKAAFDAADLEAGSWDTTPQAFEDFEQDWGWGPGNQDAQAAFAPHGSGVLVAGPTEDFESGWTTIAI